MKRMHFFNQTNFGFWILIKLFRALYRKLLFLCYLNTHFGSLSYIEIPIFVAYCCVFKHEQITQNKSRCLTVLNGKVYSIQIIYKTNKRKLKVTNEFDLNIDTRELVAVITFIH